MYIIMRTDLNMSRGKMIAQGGHGVFNIVHGDYCSDELLAKWRDGNQKKVVLAVNSLIGLMKIYDSAAKDGIMGAVIRDGGATEVSRSTVTCLAFPPYDKKKMAPIVGNLPLLR